MRASNGLSWGYGATTPGKLGKASRRALIVRRARKMGLDPEVPMSGEFVERNDPVDEE